MAAPGVTTPRWAPAGLPECLLDRIDAQMNSHQRARQLSSDCRFAYAGKTAENDQHAFTATVRQARA